MFERNRIGLNSKEENEPVFFRYWFFALIVSLSLTHFFYLPIFEYKFQLFELTVVVGVFFYILKFRSFPFSFNNSILSYAVLVFFLATLISLVVNSSWNVLLESLGNFYFTILFYCLSHLFFKFDLYKYLAPAAKYLMISITIIAVYAYLRLLILGDSSLFMVYNNYPYFGNVYRLEGFFNSPNMAVSVISFASLYLLWPDNKPKPVYAIILGGLISFGALSKEFLNYLAIIITSTLRKKIGKRLVCLFLLASALVSTFLTLFVFCKEGNCNEDNQVLGSPITIYENISIRPTSYFYLREVGWNTFLKYPVTGIGLGNFQELTKEIVKKGKNKCRSFDYEACDAYIGIASQIGVLHFIFIFLVGLQVFYGFKYATSFPLLLIPLLFTLYMAMESQLIGTLHFRHYWINLAILNSLILKFNSQSIKK